MGSYFGSKATSGLCQPIIALMPPHDTFIETHLGGGAIMQRKPPALRNIGIDLNERALERFHCDYPVEKVHGCAHRFLGEFPFTGRELVYSDPPPTCTRPAARGGVIASSTPSRTIASSWRCSRACRVR